MVRVPHNKRGTKRNSQAHLVFAMFLYLVAAGYKNIFAKVRIDHRLIYSTHPALVTTASSVERERERDH